MMMSISFVLKTKSTQKLPCSNKHTKNWRCFKPAFMFSCIWQPLHFFLICYKVSTWLSYRFINQYNMFGFQLQLFWPFSSVCRYFIKLLIKAMDGLNCKVWKMFLKSCIYYWIWWYSITSCNGSYFLLKIGQTCYFKV